MVVVARTPHLSLHNEHKLISLSAEIVSAHVAHNTVGVSDLGKLIASVHASLAGLGATTADSANTEQQPAVSVRASVKPGYIVCLEDGKQYAQAPPADRSPAYPWPVSSQVAPACGLSNDRARLYQITQRHGAPDRPWQSSKRQKSHLRRRLSRPIPSLNRC